jgi:hypothetical protein
MARRCRCGYKGVKLAEKAGSAGGWAWGKVISAIVAGCLIRRSPRSTLGEFDGLRVISSISEKNGQIPKDILLTRAMGENYHFHPTKWVGVNTFLHAA